MESSLPLSMVIIFCDKDYGNIKNIIERIRKVVKINYEVILIDNREKKKDCPLGFDFCDDVKIYSKDYNCYQFEARKFSLQFCSGEYVWFIDGDDNISGETEIGESIYDTYLSKNYDMVVFNAKMINYPDPVWYVLQHMEFGDKIITGDEVFTNTTVHMVSEPLWNKFIKMSVFKKAADQLPDNVKIISSEDVLYSMYSLKESRNIICSSSLSLYEYNMTDSFSASRKSRRYESIKELMSGKKLSDSLMINCLNQLNKSISDYRNYAELWNIKNVRYFTDKILKYGIPSEIDKSIDLLIEYFGKDMVMKSLDSHVFTPSTSVNSTIRKIYNKCISGNYFEGIKISIPIVFIERDVPSLFRILQCLGELTFNKEVVFVDNRSDRSVQLPKGIYDYKYVDIGRNVSSVEARSIGVDNCSGEYIWSIDPDDIPVNIPSWVFEILRNGIDVFNFDIVYGNRNPYVRDIFCNNMIINGRMYNLEEECDSDYILQSGLWNKIVKRDIMKDVYKMIGENHDTDYGGEDEYISFYMRIVVKTCYKVDNKMYIFVGKDEAPFGIMLYLIKKAGMDKITRDYNLGKIKDKDLYMKYLDKFNADYCSNYGIIMNLIMGSCIDFGDESQVRTFLSCKYGDEHSMELLKPLFYNIARFQQGDTDGII